MRTLLTDLGRKLRAVLDQEGLQGHSRELLAGRGSFACSTSSTRWQGPVPAAMDRQRRQALLKRAI